MHKLIIVDDEKIIRDGLDSYFKSYDSGFEVVGVFENATLALDFLRKHPCDVVFTDIRMDKMSGLDLAKAVYDEKMKTLLVLISGYGEFEYAQKALKYKVFDYILKPVRFKQLDELLKRLKDSMEETADQKDDANFLAEYDETEKRKNQTLMEKALEYIDNNLERDLNLAEVATYVHFSPMYFSRIFKIHTGLNFTEYIIRKRLDKAKELLAQGMKVQEVSICIGYENTKYFIRLFKKKLGITPGIYQRNHRKGMGEEK